ncbi:hypothetical protein AB0G04_40740 [Actinoplanes sp. NPDC023801]|uniref:hypothetical protein n=1 Tax=Actinoplanes sp. NPDC023801 TaxID=3154595 RepID=UPI0033F6516F
MPSSMMKRGRGRAAVTGALVGLGLLAAGQTPAAAVSDPAGERVAVTMSTAWGEVTYKKFTEFNGNYTARCRKGQAYFTAKYSGDYRVFVRLGRAEVSDYGDYEGLKAGSFYFSNALTNARNIHGDYVYPALENNLNLVVDSDDYDLYDDYVTLGIWVQDKETDEYLWSNLWNFSLLCGNDYTIEINDV